LSPTSGRKDAGEREKGVARVLEVRPEGKDSSKCSAAGEQKDKKTITSKELEAKANRAKQ